jgi:apolipoprotein N-acyltransferase
MSFVLLLFPAAIAIGLHIRRTSPKRALQVAGAGVGVLAAVLVFGAVRLALPQKQMVRVGLITSDEKANATVTDPGADTERLFRSYAHQAKRLATDGAQAIVMPEKLGGSTDVPHSNTTWQTAATSPSESHPPACGSVAMDGPLEHVSRERCS